MSDRWARNYARCINCRQTDSPHKSRGLCARCAQQDRRDVARLALPFLPMLPLSAYERPRPCRQCGTTIRPQHSDGLCTDCVRAAGRLHHDPWEDVA